MIVLVLRLVQKDAYTFLSVDCQPVYKRRFAGTMPKS